jgi:hypothetical protein
LSRYKKGIKRVPKPPKTAGKDRGGVGISICICIDAWFWVLREWLYYAEINYKIEHRYVLFETKGFDRSKICRNGKSLRYEKNLQSGE